MDEGLAGVIAADGWTGIVERALAGPGSPPFRAGLCSGKEFACSTGAEGDRFGMARVLTAPLSYPIPEPVRDRTIIGLSFSLGAFLPDGELAGAARIECEPDNGLFWLDAVFVSPEERGRGAGRTLIRGAALVYAAFMKEASGSWGMMGMDAVSPGGCALSALARQLSEEMLAAHRATSAS